MKKVSPVLDDNIHTDYDDEKTHKKKFSFFFNKNKLVSLKHLKSLLLLDLRKLLTTLKMLFVLFLV